MPTIVRDFPEQAGVSMAYTVQGKGDPPLVFVHGFACAHGDWNHQTDALSGSHRVLACNLPGHGESTPRIRGCRVEELGHQVAAMLEAEDVDGAYLVGHSMGCRVVMQAYLDAPERIRGLVLVDGSWIGQGDPAELEANARAVFERGGFQDTVAGLFADMFLDTDDPARAKAVVKRAEALDPEVGTTLFASLVGWDATHTERVVGALGCRLLVIQSTYLNENRQRIAISPGQSTPWLDLVRSRKPDAQVEVVPGVGHFTMLEAPERVNSLIQRFAT